jgi:hypothetical protein
LALSVNEVGEILLGVADRLADLDEVQQPSLPRAAQGLGAGVEALGGLGLGDEGGHWLAGSKFTNRSAHSIASSSKTGTSGGTALCPQPSRELVQVAIASSRL